MAAWTRTRKQIRDLARAQADQVNGTFCTDATINLWIEQEIAALWRILVEADPDRYYKTSTISTSTGTKSYALPTDFYRALAVEVEEGDQRYPLERFHWAERNALQSIAAPAVIGDSSVLRYRIAGHGLDGSTAEIHFEPDPGTRTIRLVYVEVPQRLADDNATLDSVAGWEDYVIYRVSARMRAKADDDAQFEHVMIAQLERQIRSDASERDSARPDRVQDVRNIHFGVL